MLNNFVPKSGEYIPLQKDAYFPDFKTECIIVDKVYFSCQQRECFEEVLIPIPCEDEFEVLGVSFNPGKIIKDTLVITPIPNRPNFSRVRFRVNITFNLSVREKCDKKNVLNIIGELPEIQKDIIMFIPKARDEFSFHILIETASKLLTEPVQENGYFVFSVGVFIIVKVVGRVQLLIPAFEFCPEPPDCEDFLGDEICFEFDTAPFPDFFPPQLEDIVDNF